MSALTLETLQERLTTLEAEVKQLKQQREQDKPDEPRGWQRLVGVFADDPVFEEAVRYGQEWRRREDWPEDGEEA